MTLAMLSGVFVLLMLLRVPIAFALGIASLAAMLLSLAPDSASMTVSQKLVAPAFSFTLVAIPMFVLAGKLMAAGGVARRLIEFARVSIGWLPGGLAMTNVLANMLFGSVSGSAAAAASGIGGFMIPAMQRQGYPRGFSAALTATSATTGLLIPPSNVMLIYASVAGGVSISALFVAGYLPGLMLAMALMAVAFWISRARGYGEVGERPTLRALFRATLGMLPSFALLFVIMGGIVGGWFTATEASAVAVLYSAVLAFVVYREMRWSDLVQVLKDTAAITGMVFMLIGTSLCLAWIFAYAELPATIIGAFAGFEDRAWLVLLVINLILLAVGTFMDITPAILIFTPIFLPLMMSIAPMFGLSPEAMKYHFGIVMVFNLCLGLVTPPAGTTLFIAAGIAKTSIGEISKALWPIFAVAVAVLLIVSYTPATTLALPRYFELLP
jgi:tripartite ATP-independent transporter DctM subunit